MLGNLSATDFEGGTDPTRRHQILPRTLIRSAEMEIARALSQRGRS